jgi:hypothetical protein
MGGEVSVDSETTIGSASSTQSLGGAHGVKVYVYAFIKVNVRVYI